MPIPDKVKRRLVRSVGHPSLVLKIYDESGDDERIELLLRQVENRGFHQLGFAGVAHVIDFQKYGFIADLQVYGRNRSENPEDVYPFSMVISDGSDLPHPFGRACLEETVLFGKEASLYLSQEEPRLSSWLKTFAL